MKIYNIEEKKDGKKKRKAMPFEKRAMKNEKKSGNGTLLQQRRERAMAQSKDKHTRKVYACSWARGKRPCRIDNEREMRWACRQTNKSCVHVTETKVVCLETNG